MKNPTGIFVNAGDLLYFERAGGEWTGDKNNASMDRGCGISWADPFPEHTWRLPPEEGTAGGLIGYIGDQPFFIGCNPVEMVAPASGELYLGMNDCLQCFWDNGGVLYVNIKVTPGS